MLLDGCSSKTIALCFCLVWLMYFALMQINWPFFFCPIHQQQSWLYCCQTAGVGRCLLFWKPAPVKISFLHGLWRSVHTHSVAWKRLFPKPKSVILVLIKYGTYTIRVAILRDCACIRDSNWLQIRIKKRDWGVHYSSILSYLDIWIDLSSLPFGHDIWKYCAFLQQWMVLSYISHLQYLHFTKTSRSYNVTVSCLIFK